MSSDAWVSFTAEIRRKSDDLPRYIEVPARTVSGLGISGTTPVVVRLNQSDVGRRNLKAWGRGRDVWFFNLTERQCADAGIDTGDRVTVRMRLASSELPTELEQLLEADEQARRNWESLTDSQRRMLSDHVREAKREGTRRRRAKRGLLERE